MHWELHFLNPEKVRNVRTSETQHDSHSETSDCRGVWTFHTDSDESTATVKIYCAVAYWWHEYKIINCVKLLKLNTVNNWLKITRKLFPVAMTAGAQQPVNIYTVYPSPPHAISC